MRFILGELDFADKVGISHFFVFGDSVSGDKEDGIGPIDSFGWEAGFTTTLR